MGKHSAIEWTDHTFNPWWGCVKVSPACANCYAEMWARRMGLDLWNEHSPRRFFSDRHWNEPLSWNQSAAKEGIRSRVFCSSMADVFEDRKDLNPWRDKLWNLIEQTRNLDWLLLTKRPENVHAMAPWKSQWPANIWLGTTVENQALAQRRIAELIKFPAKVKFLSCEPLLGPLDLSKWLTEIDWVIVGGESGRKARPLNPEWVRSLRDQVISQGIAFFFKQWGEFQPIGNQMERVGKKVAGKNIDGRTWQQIPSFQ